MTSEIINKMRKHKIIGTIAMILLLIVFLMIYVAFIDSYIPIPGDFVIIYIYVYIYVYIYIPSFLNSRGLIKFLIAIAILIIFKFLIFLGLMIISYFM